jgi:PBS lyase HEAT-like repeat-containing protein
MLIGRVPFVLAGGIPLAFGILPGTVATPAAAQEQITSCVEVAPAVVSESRRRSSTRSDCDPQTARNKARDRARVNARDALGSVCRDAITEAEAVEVCSAASGAIPTSSGTSLSAEPFPVPGGSEVSAQLPIAQSDPKLCVVLRDLPGETQTGTRGNALCVLNNFRETVVTFRARARCGVQCFDVNQHRLQVRRFTTAALTNANADSILADATTVLKTDEGAGDVACSVTLARAGSVATFTQGDGSIDSGAEFSSLIALPGHVKVVNAINFCGTLLPNVIGCAPVPGNSLAIVRFTAGMEGILWLHEFGHNKGLSHRNDANAVMNGTIGPTRRRVTSAECGAYGTLGQPAIAPAAAAAPAEAADVSPPDVRSMDIKEFVRQTFIHGVPYEEASRYPPDVVPTLLEMLKDRAEEPHWPNIVVVLGMIGDERALDPLIAFIEQGGGTLSAAHYRAKTSAIMSLGYLINKTGNRKALDYLARGLVPEAWAARAAASRAPYQATTIERNRDFAKHAILGLALSGHPEAAQALRSLQQPAVNESQRRFRAQVSDLVAQALKEHQQISSRGLADYYRSK